MQTNSVWTGYKTFSMNNVIISNTVFPRLDRAHAIYFITSESAWTIQGHSTLSEFLLSTQELKF